MHCDAKLSFSVLNDVLLEPAYSFAVSHPSQKEKYRGISVLTAFGEHMRNE